MRTATRPLLTLIATLGLAACASGGGGTRFACPHPQGVTCLSPTAIYAATDHRPSLESGRDGQPANVPQAAPPQRSTAETRVDFRIDDDGLALIDAATTAPVLRAEAESAVTYRTPAKVLRIWIAPWEDQAGDLHLANRVYTEIESRRWLVGEPAVTPALPVLTLLPQPAVARSDPTPPSAATPPAGHSAVVSNASNARQ